MVDVICAVCGKQFQGHPGNIKRGHGKYCSIECRSTAKRALAQLNCVCKLCGKDFHRKPSEIIKYSDHYCSRECKSLDQKRGEMVICARCGKEFYRTRANKKTGKYCSLACNSGVPATKLTCARCGKEFTAHHCNIIKGAGKFCSLSCASGEPPVKKICKQCGKEFAIRQSHVKIGEGHYCSKACLHKSQAGSGNPAWCGGISFEPYCPKFNKKFKDMVRERFHRRCFLCGISENGCRHDVHHIDYAKNSICNGKEWAFVPLCHTHHMATNSNRWYWFNSLINYWAMRSEINFGSDEYVYKVGLVGT